MGAAGKGEILVNGIREGSVFPYRSPDALGEMPPSPEERLDFLRKLQRLLKEGDFTATYKFALLQSLLDIAVESRIAGRETLAVSWRQLADKFIEYYWNHTEPYRTGACGDGVLMQSAGRQAAVVSRISRARQQSGAQTLARLRRDAALHSIYERLARDVALTIRTQPVKYIQNVNGGQLEFLFLTGDCGITLLPGVAWCLREFHDLLQGQVRAGWIGQIRTIRQNKPIIGGHEDLEIFLFGNSRIPLGRIRERLADIDGTRCFYCGTSIRGTPEVDHFVPWARYPRDLGHNFVLAHGKCNQSKRDTLASDEHFAHWISRIDERGSPLSDALSEIVTCDSATSKRVAQWAYRRDIDASAAFWAGVQQGRPVYRAAGQVLAELL